MWTPQYLHACGGKFFMSYDSASSAASASSPSGMPIIDSSPVTVDMRSVLWLALISLCEASDRPRTAADDSPPRLPTNDAASDDWLCMAAWSMLGYMAA